MKYCIILCLFLLFSCKEKAKFKLHNKHFEDVEITMQNAKHFKTSTNSLITYNLSKEVNITSDSLIHNAEYLILESTKNSRIAQIDKIYFLDSLIVILDRDKAKAVFLFDKYGKFIRKIKKLGTGENDYSTISSLQIDHANKEIVVFDNKISKLFFFDFNGSFKRMLKVGLRFRDFIITEPNTWILTTNNLQNDHLPDIDHFNLLVLKDNKEIVYKDNYINPLYDDLPLFGRHLITIGDINYYFPRFCDTVFKVTPDGMKQAIYKFNDPTLIPSTFLDNDLNRKAFRSQIIKNQFSYFMGNFNENTDHIFTSISVGKNGNINSDMVIIDKASQNTLKISGIENNSSKINYPAFGLPLTVYDNKFVSVVTAGYFQGLKKVRKQVGSALGLSTDMSKLLDLLEDDPNPVIMKYTLRKL